MRALANRLRRLEVMAGSTGPCPACPDWKEMVHLRDDAPEPPSCPVCGRRPVVCRLVHVADFYSNRERLDALEEA
jgi:hypothetical protein